VEDECTVYNHDLTPCDLFEQPGSVQYPDTLGAHPVELEKPAPLVAPCMEVYEQQKDNHVTTAGNAARRVANDSYIKVSKRKPDCLLNRICERIILQAQRTSYRFGHSKYFAS